LQGYHIALRHVHLFHRPQVAHSCAQSGAFERRRRCRIAQPQRPLDRAGGSTRRMGVCGSGRAWEEGCWLHCAAQGCCAAAHRACRTSSCAWQHLERCTTLMSQVPLDEPSASAGGAHIQARRPAQATTLCGSLCVALWLWPCGGGGGGAGSPTGRSGGAAAKQHTRHETRATYSGSREERRETGSRRAAQAARRTLRAARCAHGRWQEVRELAGVLCLVSCVL
jgi:hypothetical protein